MLSALAIALVLTAGPSSVEADLSDALKQLRTFKEQKALETLKHARANAAGDPRLLARVQLITGLAHAQLAHEKDAVEAFSAAVKLDPEIAPSEEDTSPKVLEWFNRVRADAGLTPLGEERVKKQDTPPPEPKIVYVEKEVPVPVEAPKPRTGLYVGLGAIGVGAIAGGIGLLYGMRAKNLSDLSKSQTHWEPEVEYHSQAVTASRVSNIAWVTGALFAIGGGVVLAGDF